MEKISLEKFQELYIDEFKKIIDVFELNNIRYSLAFGTLLGAIREKNIIKWDYDIDIFVEDCQADKIINIFRNLNYKVKTFKNGESSFGLSRIYLNNLYRQRFDEKTPNSAFMDVFHYRIVDNNIEFITKLKRRLSKFAYYNHIKYDNYIPKSRIKRFMRKLLPSYRSTYKRNIKLFDKFNTKNEIILPMYYNDIDKHYPFTSTYVLTNFGKYKFKCFSNYDEILTIKYGNWKKPINDGKVNAMQFYKAS